MKLSSLIDKDFIKLGVELDSFESVVDYAIELFARKDFPVGKDKIKAAILERESLETTALPSGLAVPHTRLTGFDDLRIAIIVPKEPITIADTAVRCFSVIVTSQTASNIYLQTLATMAKLSSDVASFDKVVKAANPEQVMAEFARYDVKKNITVLDVMNTELDPVTPDMTLKELADFFYSKNLTYAPVVENGELIGEVTIFELLQVGIPNYAMMIGSLDFLSSFEPFEALLSNENKIKVAEVMRKPKGRLKPETSLVEAALELTQERFRFLPVVDNGNFVGVISVDDLLTKVIRR